MALQLPDIDTEADRLPRALLESLTIQPEHVQKALSLTNPSTLRETAIEVPNVKWEDIGVAQTDQITGSRYYRSQTAEVSPFDANRPGGLEEVKRELKETVQYPVQYADKFELFGMTAAKGVLFYGPPGHATTLETRELASTSYLMAL